MSERRWRARYAPDVRFPALRTALPEALAADLAAGLRALAVFFVDARAAVFLAAALTGIRSPG